MSGCGLPAACGTEIGRLELSNNSYSTPELKPAKHDIIEDDIVDDAHQPVVWASPVHPVPSEASSDEAGRHVQAEARAAALHAATIRVESAKEEAESVAHKIRQEAAMAQAKALEMAQVEALEATFKREAQREAARLGAEQRAREQKAKAEGRSTESKVKAERQATETAERKRKPFELPKQWSDKSRRAWERDKDKPSASVLQALSDLDAYKGAIEPPLQRSASVPLPPTINVGPLRAAVCVHGAQRPPPTAQRSSSGPPFAKRPRHHAPEPPALGGKLSSLVSILRELESGHDATIDSTSTATSSEESTPVAELIDLLLKCHAEDPRHRAHDHAPHERLYHLWRAIGVEPWASRPVLRKRFLALALRLHPDKCSHLQAREAFQRLHAIYRKLTEGA